MKYPDILNAVTDMSTASREDHPLAETITASRYLQVRALDEIIPRGILTSNALSTTDWAQGQCKDNIL